MTQEQIEKLREAVRAEIAVAMCSSESGALRWELAFVADNAWKALKEKP